MRTVLRIGFGGRRKGREGDCQPGKLVGGYLGELYGLLPFAYAVYRNMQGEKGDRARTRGRGRSERQLCMYYVDRRWYE